MKKALSLLIAISLLASLTACGAKSETTSTTAQAQNAASTEEKSTTKEETTAAAPMGIETDEGLLTDSVTVPGSFFKDETEEDIKKNAQEKGYLSCTINDDGSVTYTMTKIKHQEMLDDMRTSLEETLVDYCNPESDSYVDGFEKIESNKDFTKFDIYMDGDKYNSFSGLYLLAFYLSGAMYQCFDGVDPEDIDVKVSMIDSESKEVLVDGSYKAWREKQQQNAENEKAVEKEAEDAQAISLGDSMKIGNDVTLEFKTYEWCDKIVPSKTDGVYSYMSDVDGEKYLVIRGTITNDSGAEIDPSYCSRVELVMNDKYNYDGEFKVESSDGTDFYGGAKPLQTLNTVLYFSVPDEAKDKFESGVVTVKMNTKEEDFGSFYDDDKDHKIFKIKF